MGENQPKDRRRFWKRTGNFLEREKEKEKKWNLLSRDKVKRSQFALLLSTLIKHFPLYDMNVTKLCHPLVASFSTIQAYTMLFYNFIALFVSHFSLHFLGCYCFHVECVYVLSILLASCHSNEMRRMTIKSEWWRYKAFITAFVYLLQHNFTFYFSSNLEDYVFFFYFYLI